MVLVLKLFLVQVDQLQKEEQKGNMVADIYNDCQMLLIVVIGDLHSLDISSLCHVYLLFYQGHVTAYFGFPTMPGMNDVMFMHYHE